MADEPTTKFLTAEGLAAKLRAAGITCHNYTPREWSRRFPISQVIGGRRLFDQRIADFLIDGRSLDDVAAVLCVERLRRIGLMPQNDRPPRRTPKKGPPKKSR